MRLRDELGVFYNGEDFAQLYPVRGQPARSLWRLTMILIMQFLENLSDRQAADAVRGRSITPLLFPLTLPMQFSPDSICMKN